MTKIQKSSATKIQKSSKSILKKQHIQKIVAICLDAKNPSKPKADSRKEEESSTQSQPDSKSEALNTAG